MLLPWGESQSHSYTNACRLGGFDPRLIPRVRNIAKKVGAKAVIVPLGVGGVPDARDGFSFIDLIISQIAAAY